VDESDLPPVCPAIRRLTAMPGAEAEALPPAEAAIPPTAPLAAARSSWLLPTAALLGTFLGGLLVWHLWPPQPSSPPQPQAPKARWLNLDRSRSDDGRGRRTARTGLAS
jgi:hypothetical protein